MFFRKKKLSSLRRQADNCRDQQNWTQAAKLYKKYIAKLTEKEDPFQFYVQMGNCLKEANDFDASLNAYMDAEQLNRSNSDLYLQMGHLYKLRENWAEAQKSYKKSLDLDNQNLIAQWELHNMSQEQEVMNQKKEVLDDRSMPVVWFDVSDILGYFPDNRSPTGIQRVQISILTAIIENNLSENVALCRFLEEEDGWYKVDYSAFIYICELSLGGSSTQDPDWRGAVAALYNQTVSSPIEKFPYKSVIFNLGTSWWLPNYFVHIREAKKRSSIYYVPLIHDVIPAKTPQYCAHELVHEFIDWLMGVVQHADAYMTVSESTKVDFIGMMKQLNVKHDASLIKVVHLAAERQSNSRKSSEVVDNYLLSGLKNKPFVLFVSTVESRKNQVGAVQVWANLYRKYGEKKIPKLVIVGKKGFESHFFLEKMSSALIPKDFIIYIESVSDEELGFLYRNSLFTIYPSFYEGWGLPITESLGYGKVVLTADNSSLPEAGQGLTELYATGSNVDFELKAIKLISDENYLKEKERKISEHFRDRSWLTIADEMISYAAAIQESTSEPHVVVPVLPMGYYSFARNRKIRIQDEMTSSEVLRIGSGWHRLEDFGCWAKPSGGRLAFSTTHNVRRIAVQLKGLPSKKSNIVIMSNLSNKIKSGTLNPDATSWFFIENVDGREIKNIEIYLSSDTRDVLLDPITKQQRHISVGLCAISLSGIDNPNYKTDFIEDCLFDLHKYRVLNRLPCA